MLLYFQSMNTSLPGTGVCADCQKMNEEKKKKKKKNSNESGNKLALLTMKKKLFGILLERIHRIWHARLCTSILLLFQSDEHLLN